MKQQYSKYQPEGTFGTFLDMMKQKKSAESSRLENNVVRLLSTLMEIDGGPIAVDDLYKKCGLRFPDFGEALKMMLSEGMIVMDYDQASKADTVSLSPHIRERL